MTGYPTNQYSQQAGLTAPAIQGQKQQGITSNAPSMFGAFNPFQTGSQLFTRFNSTPYQSPPWSPLGTGVGTQHTSGLSPVGPANNNAPPPAAGNNPPGWGYNVSPRQPGAYYPGDEPGGTNPNYYDALDQLFGGRSPSLNPIGSQPSFDWRSTINNTYDSSGGRTGGGGGTVSNPSAADRFGGSGSGGGVTANLGGFGFHGSPGSLGGPGGLLSLFHDVLGLS